MIETLLSLEHWREIMGLDPFHFWGLADGAIHPVNSSCNDTVDEYTWQGGADRVGREEIRQAIAIAEQRLAEELHFHPAPKYEEHLIGFPKISGRSLIRVANVQAPWQRVGLQLPRGFVRKIGYQRRTYIDEKVVTLSDADGDGLNDTFTVTCPTSVTDPEELAVYFAPGERWDGSAVSEEWRVRPITITISGGTATIKGRAWTIVQPVRYQGVAAGPIDPTVAANFADSLEVYRLWYDQDGIDESNSQAVLYWETKPCHGSWCCCSGCTATTTPANSSLDPGAEARAVARAGIRDAELGIVTAGEAVRDTTTGIWSEISWTSCSEPDRVRVRALTGIAWESGEMARRWRILVARMAAAELAQRPTACEQANHELYRWQFDMSRSGGANDEAYTLITPTDLGNPFGTRRGHIYAWKEVKELRQLGGISGA